MQGVAATSTKRLPAKVADVGGKAIEGELGIEREKKRRNDEISKTL